MFPGDFSLPAVPCCPSNLDPEMLEALSEPFIRAGHARIADARDAFLGTCREGESLHKNWQESADILTDEYRGLLAQVPSYGSGRPYCICHSVCTCISSPLACKNYVLFLGGCDTS